MFDWNILTAIATTLLVAGGFHKWTINGIKKDICEKINLKHDVLLEKIDAIDNRFQRLEERVANLERRENG